MESGLNNGFIQYGHCAHLLGEKRFYFRAPEKLFTSTPGWPGGRHYNPVRRSAHLLDALQRHIDINL